MPVELAAHVTRLQTNAVSCNAAFTMEAGIEALVGPQDAPAAMVQEFRKRRDLIVDGLNAIPGIKCLKPKGAFYVFPNVASFGLSSKEMENYLMDEAGVAVLSGRSFGEFGEGFLRLSYANSIPNIEKALKNIKAAVAKL
jgi:aspartate/methionine/tyrosine aminotransferase